LLKEILNSYCFRGPLKRIPFVATVVVLSVLVGYVSLTLRQKWLAGGGSGLSYVVIA
jgi:hypothetical protein